MPRVNIDFASLDFYVTWLVAKGFKVVTAFKPGEPCTA
jgi:hypothetical protein